MSETPKALVRMLDAWNERDPEKIRSHLDDALADEVIFIDPTHSIVGLDQFEAMVREFRSQFPDAVCSRASGIDSHHDLHRYGWEIHRDGTLMVPGFDVAQLNERGQVCRVEGFFGPLPPLPGA
jgi:hypothetical protein